MRPIVKRLAAFVGLTAVLALSACSADDGEPQDPAGTSATHAALDPAIGITVDGDGAAVAPSDDAQVVVEVFSDFLCPFCKEFEAENSQALLDLAGDDRFDVRWRPVAWLDRHSAGTEFSTRSAALLLHVAQESPEHFWDALEAIMQVQADGPRLTDAELADVAASVGVETDAVAAITDSDLRAQVLAFSNAASQLQVRHVPWIVIDGEQWDPSADGAGTLFDAAHAALG
ncbi:DsbA family protein [Xylanimonas ulmi]|uniref:Protein-disulfide isomerase n=1 Tax=Xylanimonas ulmi TaxID=228973 RepID=A0A4Q7M2E9_9MICO|nr:thioredoxin domain-containing protein [Xylanibacterium ulmi]RZS61441.1 protein-disulfide isomerase [Xylanibacterium ulmi]